MDKCQSMFAILVIGLGCLIASPLWADEAIVKSPPPERFAKQIEAFARQDTESFPENGVIVFVGSSSIRLWNLSKSFGNLNAINRGFGGSQISDVLHYADQTVLKYKPKKVVFFCGGNDLNYGKSPEQVAGDFQIFTKRLFNLLPETELIVLAIKPSPSRWGIVDKVRAANDRLRAAAKKDSRIVFLDGAFGLLLDEEGNVREELYAKDRLHLNDKGYKLWADMLAPYLRLKKLGSQ